MKRTRVRKRTDDETAAEMARALRILLRTLRRGARKVPYRDVESEKKEARRILVENTPGFRPGTVEDQQCNLSFAEVAKLAKISQSTVGAVAARLGIVPPARKGRPSGVKTKFSPHREPAYALFKSGMKTGEVAKELDIARQQVHVFYKDWLLMQKKSPSEN